MVRLAPARLTIAGTRIVGSRAAVRGMVTPKGRSGQPECRGGMAQHRGAGAVLPGEVEATAVELPEGAQHRWVRVAAPAGAGPLHAVLGIVLARALHRPRADEVAPVTVQDTGCQHIQPDLPALPGQPPLDRQATLRAWCRCIGARRKEHTVAGKGKKGQKQASPQTQRAGVRWGCWRARLRRVPPATYRTGRSSWTSRPLCRPPAPGSLSAPPRRSPRGDRPDAAWCQTPPLG